MDFGRQNAKIGGKWPMLAANSSIERKISILGVSWCNQLSMKHKWHIYANAFVCKYSREEDTLLIQINYSDG